MPIPFVDLGAQYHTLQPEMDAAIKSVLERSAFIMDKENNKFGHAFAEYVGVKQCIGVSTGADALELALKVGWADVDND